MSDVAGFYVVLEKDISDEYAEAVLNAIRQIRGVLDVKPHVADMDLYIAQERARMDLSGRLLKALREG